MHYNKKYGGMISQEIKGELFQTLSHRVRPDVNGRTHKPSATLVVLYTQSFNYFRSWLRQLMPWVGRGMAVNVVCR